MIITRVYAGGPERVLLVYAGHPLDSCPLVSPVAGDAPGLEEEDEAATGVYFRSPRYLLTVPFARRFFVLQVPRYHRLSPMFLHVRARPPR